MTNLLHFLRSRWTLPFIALVLCGLAPVRPARAAPGAGVGTAHAAPVIVADDLGRRIVLPNGARRIISLAPSVTEILYAVGGGSRLVADTSYCDYPAAARALPRVGGPMTPSAERIVALHADLAVVASQTLSRAEADRLAAAWHTPVYVTAAASYRDVMTDIARLGSLAGTPQATKTCLDRMRRALALARRATAGRAKPKVFIVVWQNPLMTASGTSFIGDLVRLAGGRNVAESTPGPYPTYSPERLVRDDPDIVLTGIPRAASGAPPDIVSPDDPRLAAYLDRVRAEPLTAAWRLAVRAVRQGRVRGIPADWTDRPGPRLALGLVAMARAIRSQAAVTAAPGGFRSR